MHVVISGVQAGCIFHMHREVRPVTQVPPTTHHSQIDASAPTRHLHGQYVYIAVGHVVYRLLVQHIGQRCHLIAQFCRLLKLKAVSYTHLDVYKRQPLTKRS